MLYYSYVPLRSSELSPFFAITYRSNYGSSLLRPFPTAGQAYLSTQDPTVAKDQTPPSRDLIANFFPGLETRDDWHGPAEWPKPNQRPRSYCYP